MSDQSTQRAHQSMLSWERLEAWVREKARAFLPTLLEEEVTTFLGRRKSGRWAVVDPPPGYRNEYGKPCRLGLTSGTITVRRPRLRGLSGIAHRAGEGEKPISLPSVSYHRPLNRLSFSRASASILAGITFGSG